MAKTLVVDPAQHTRVPFLRGILTRSLQDAGLAFDEAYAMASHIRHDLLDTSEITTKELQERVVMQLHEGHDPGVVQRYLTPPRGPEAVLIRYPDEHLVPFSRAQHRRLLEACGLLPDESTRVTTRILDHLLKKKRREISWARLAKLTHRYLKRDLSREVADRYVSWTEFVNSGRPLLLLIGGTAGCGKSTISTELGTRLDIVRTQSTDMLREVMRTVFPKRLLPTLHTSSFNAWQALPGHGEEAGVSEPTLADGYRAQAHLVAVACEAVIGRAIRERVSLILEGVHVNPGLIEEIPVDPDVTTVGIMLAVLNPSELRKRIRGRGSNVPQRPSARYLRHFDAVWQLQSFLLSEADRAGMPIVANDTKDKTIHEIVSVIHAALPEPGRLAARRTLP